MPPASLSARYEHNRCIVCASGDTSKGIGSAMDEESVMKLMKYFWDGLCVDVKPLDSLKHEVCQQCSVKIIEFYDTNEVLLQLEKHLRSLQKALVLSCTEGIKKLKAEGHPLLPIHKNLFDKWGNGFKSEDEEEIDSQNQENKISTYIVETEQSIDDAGPSPSSGAKGKSPPKPRSKGRPRRAASKKQSLAESDSEDPDEVPEKMDTDDDLDD